MTDIKLVPGRVGQFTSTPLAPIHTRFKFYWAYMEYISDIIILWFFIFCLNNKSSYTRISHWSYVKGGSWVNVRYEVCSKSVDTGMNNEWNINFLQNSPLGIQKLIPVRFPLVKKSMKLLFWHDIWNNTSTNLFLLTYLSILTPEMNFSV